MTFGPQLRPGQLGEADPTVVERVLASGSARVTEINRTTRDGLNDVIAEGIRQGMGPAELGDAINSWSGWDEYRAEMIARTETGMAYNETALATYREGGVEQVHVTDGDDDEICEPWANWTGPIDDAPEPLGHPNCTRDFEPIVEWTPEDYAAAQESFGAPAEPIVSAPEPPTTVLAPTPPVAEPAPVAPAAPTPSIADIVTPGGPKPVSAAFDTAMQRASSGLAARDPRYTQVRDKIDRALNVIGRTFRDGNLPEMPQVGPLVNPKPGVWGMYSHGDLGMRMPQALEFRPTANAETVFHEISHFIDQHGLGVGGQFASRMGFARSWGTFDQLTAAVERRIAIERNLGPVIAGTQREAEIAQMSGLIEGMTVRADLMEPVARAIIESDGYKTLKAAKLTGVFSYPKEQLGRVVIATERLGPKAARFTSYATEPAEAFARAMAQYLSRRAGPEAMSQIEERLYAKSVTTGAFLTDEQGARVLSPLADQWTDADFAPIDKAITELLDKLGWLVH